MKAVLYSIENIFKLSLKHLFYSAVSYNLTRSCVSTCMILKKADFTGATKSINGW